MQRVKRDDTVKVIAGKDAGTKTGRVLAVYPKTGKVLVEGVNLVTRHERVRQSRRGAREGGISQVEAPLDLSNVMPIDPSCGQPTRVATRVVGDRRVRYCRRCGAEF
jgi:large subunit ribosomal protein L24